MVSASTHCAPQTGSTISAKANSPTHSLTTNRAEYQTDPPHTGGAIDWHQDDYYFRIDKLNAVGSYWIAFDQATVDSGCMWVIHGVHTQLWPQ